MTSEVFEPFSDLSIYLKKIEFPCDFYSVALSYDGWYNGKTKFLIEILGYKNILLPSLALSVLMPALSGRLIDLALLLIFMPFNFG